MRNRSESLQYGLNSEFRRACKKSQVTRRSGAEKRITMLGRLPVQDTPFGGHTGVCQDRSSWIRWRFEFLKRTQCRPRCLPPRTPLATRGLLSYTWQAGKGLDPFEGIGWAMCQVRTLNVLQRASPQRNSSASGKSGCTCGGSSFFFPMQLSYKCC